MQICREQWMGLAALLLIAGSVSAIAQDKVDLDIELPRPLFIGTPKDIRTPNLETPRKEKERPTFQVPKGSRNVALGKDVLSSDMDPIIGELELVTDGDKQGEEGSYVELGPERQWLQIDLGKAYAIHALVVWHFHSQARVYRDVVVQVASDPDFIMDVHTVFNNDHDNSSGMGVGKHKDYIETYEGRIIDAGGVDGRYVRLYSNGSSSGEMNHYVEVEVHATEP